MSYPVSNSGYMKDLEKKQSSNALVSFMDNTLISQDKKIKESKKDLPFPVQIDNKMIHDRNRMKDEAKWLKKVLNGTQLYF